MLILCLIDFLVEVQAFREDICGGSRKGEAGGWQNLGDHHVSCLIMCVGEDTHLRAYRGEETDAQQEQ